MTTSAVRGARQQRLDGILECLMGDEAYSPQRLAAQFGVSVMTIHRDLDELQRRGMVRKYHGGVSVERTSSYEIAAALRRRIAVPQKRALAEAAAKLVSPGQVLLLDDSTTVSHMAPYLHGVEGLRVVTNYLPLMAEFADSGDIELQGLGGDYDHGHESFLGLGAIAAVSALRTDWAFVSTTTADAAGLYHQEEKIVALKTAMLKSARQRVLLLDSTKMEQTSLHLIGGWDWIDHLITDEHAPVGLLEQLRSLIPAVTIVAAEPGQAA